MESVVLASPVGRRGGGGRGQTHSRGPRGRRPSEWGRRGQKGRLLQLPCHSRTSNSTKRFFFASKLQLPVPVVAENRPVASEIDSQITIIMINKWPLLSSHSFNFTHSRSNTLTFWSILILIERSLTKKFFLTYMTFFSLSSNFISFHNSVLLLYQMLK